MKRLSILLLLALFGCEEKLPEPTQDQPVGGPASPKPPVPVEPRGQPAKASAVTWQKPDAWKEVEHPSKMRKATYAITKVEGDPEDAEMSVTQVAGSIRANVQRWEGQFAGGPEAKVEKRSVGDLVIEIVSLEGTYSGSMGPMMGGDTAPKDDWALLAAVVPTEPAHFFKMTGPKKTVAASRADFDKLVDSIAKK